jgi:U3 small nucleolar RNA-associated protein 3
MDTLVKLREAWINVRSLPEGEGIDEASDLEVVPMELDAPKTNGRTNGHTTSIKSDKVPQPGRTKKQGRNKIRTQLPLDASAARRSARQSIVEADLADLTALATNPTTRSTKQKSKSDSKLNQNVGSDSDFGDETELTAQEAAEKARRRKNLRFYTSQIVQKTQKRGAASRDTGGDMDIPHRERWRDKQLRLAAEAEAKRERERETQKQGKAERAHGSDDEYQDMFTKAKQDKADRKAAKKEEYEARLAKENALYGAEEIGEDGKRKINYQIEKNKGLAPYRKKEQRNPRVRKRKKYDEKKKKLSSVRAVYKGGPGPGGYQGELSGIKATLVKSVKLSR